MNLSELEVTLHTGDIVFTRIRGTPFRQLADVTRTWTNHVGIVVGFDSFGAVVAESRIPFSTRTRFASFVRRSAQGRVAVMRLSRPLSDSEIRRLECAAGCRLGRLYDTALEDQVFWPYSVGAHSSEPLPARSAACVRVC
jgi:hypothetical protein